MMKKFNKTPPTKKISVPVFAILKDGEAPRIHTIEMVGSQRIPLVVHRCFNSVIDTKPVRGRWQITHLFTGFNLGVFGSYRFCRSIANELLDEPVLYLPSEKMMQGHSDYDGLSDKLTRMKKKHWKLGGKYSRKG